MSSGARSSAALNIFRAHLLDLVRGCRPLFGATLENAFASLRLTPQSIDVENI